MQKRRQYSPEYKQEAVQLVKQSDISLAKVADNLGINSNVLNKMERESHRGVLGGINSTAKGNLDCCYRSSPSFRV